MGLSEISSLCTLHRGEMFSRLCHSPEAPDFTPFTAADSAPPILHMPFLMPPISRNSIRNMECAGSLES